MSETTNEDLFRQEKYNELYEQNIGLLKHYCVKYNKFGLDHEEALSLVSLTFAKAIKSFDPDKAKFSTYLGLLCQGAFSKYYRDSVALKRGGCDIVTVSLDQHIPRKGDYSGYSKANTLLDRVLVDDRDIEDYLGADNLYSEIMDIASNVNKNGPSIIRLVMDGHTQSHIGDKLGIGQVQVSRILIRIQKKLVEKGYCAMATDNTKKDNIKKRGYKSRQETIETIMKLYDEGETIRSISSQLGMAYSTVNTYLCSERARRKREQSPCATDTVEPVVEPTTDTVEPVVEPTTDTVEPATEPTTDAVEPVVEKSIITPSCLKIKQLEGKFCSYRAIDNFVRIEPEHCNEPIQIPSSKEDMDRFIEELQAVKAMMCK